MSDYLLEPRDAERDGYRLMAEPEARTEGDLPFGPRPRAGG